MHPLRLIFVVSLLNVCISALLGGNVAVRVSSFDEIWQSSKEQTTLAGFVGGC